ncbi:putative cuticle protein [Operophtera brumata]|uniref:Putative cuticle protein n=1 Tax=Operophtera brumata TaxID=104452 RepID=A0A0L7K2H4_OPEBR|nr:putative cuticle protein [Operophtera brumata]
MYKLVVLLCVVVMAAAKPGGVALAYGGVVPAVSSLSQYSSSVVHGSPYLAPSVYSAGPAVYPAYPGYAALAQAPHSPAVVLDAALGVPLDTPEVVAARAAHYQAKALSGLHHLKKRSAPLHYGSVVAPVGYSSPLVSAYSTPVVSAYSSPVVSAYSSPVVSAYSSPVVSAYSSPLVSAYSPLAYHGVAPKALSVHPW